MKGETPCWLESLQRVETDSPLPGLAVLQPSNQLGWQADKLACCAGSGLTVDWLPVHPPELGLRRCPLRKRFASVTALWTRYAQTVRNGTPAIPKITTTALNRLERIKRGGASRGLAFVNDLTSTELWAIALAATWRFDIAVHWITFPAAAAPLTPDWLPDDGFWSLSERRIFCVSGVSNLWDSGKAFDFGWIIQTAQLAQVPLFVHYRPGEPPSPSASPVSPRPLRSAASQRIGTLRQRHPFSWLGAASRSKLAEICDISA